MPRSVARASRRRRVRYRKKPNAINKAGKLLKRKETILKSDTAIVQEQWEKSRTLKQNMKSMGLVYDLNKAMPIVSSVSRKKAKVDAFVGEVDSAEVASMSKPKVIESLESDAAKQRPRSTRMSEPDVLFCSRMIHRYGEDFQAMAKDRRNIYQETPAQIKRKMNFFKQTHQYNAYLKAKET